MHKQYDLDSNSYSSKSSQNTNFQFDFEASRNINLIEIRKIVINKPGALGDYIASTVAIRKIRALFPKAEIHILATLYVKNVMPVGTLVDKIIDYDYYKSKGKISFITFLRKQKYDLAINLRWTSEGDLLTLAFCGAKYTLGLSNLWLSFLYTHATKCELFQTHEFEKNLMVLKPLGISCANPKPYIYISEQANEFIRLFFETNHLQKHTTWVVSPFASTEYKAWTQANFEQLCKLLIQYYKNITIVVSYGPSDRQKAEAFVSEVGTNCILSPPTNIDKLAALITACGRVVCNCSGTMNIAMACNTPTVVVSCVSTKLWGSRGKYDLNFVPENIEIQTQKNTFDQFEIQKQLTEILPQNVFESLIKSENKI